MRIDKKQICMLLFAIIPASKFLILPTVYAHFARQDAWLAGLANFLLDGFLLAVMLLIIKKFDGITLYDLLTERIGRWFANGVFVLYALFFILKAAVPLLEQRTFIEITLYETSPTIINFLPFFLVCFYFCIKGINAMARTGEIIFWSTLAGMALIFFLSAGTAELYYLMPILKNPVKQTFTGIYNGAMWYGQPIILLFLMGKIKKDKRFNLSVALSFTAAALTCVLTFVIFTGIYGDVAVRQIYSLTKMTKYSIALSNVGRLDYIATLFIAASSVLSLSVPLIFATDCLKTVFPLKRGWIIPLGVSLAMLIFTCVFHTRFKATVDFFEKFFTPVMILLVYALPIALLFFKKEKKCNGLLKASS